MKVQGLPYTMKLSEIIGYARGTWVNLKVARVLLKMFI